MRAFARALARNLAAGLRVALFLPVRRLAFRIDLPQLLALFVVSALVDVAADAMRYGDGAAFSWLGLGNEIYSGGILILSSALIALLNRDRALALAIPVIALATFPVLQLANGLSWQELGVPDAWTGVVDDVVLAWILVVLVRIVHVALEYRRGMRAVRAFAGGVVLAVPIFLSPAIMTLEPWFAPPARDAADPRYPSPASEPVLSEQRRILDEALDAIEDGRPGVTDLYFAGFAGDANEPAYRADVEAAVRAMDEGGGTAGRSIALLNDPRTLLTDPIASLTHLRDTLDEFAAAMDPDEDIAMVYLAAPSRRNGELDVRMPPLELVPISAAGVRSAFDDAGIRYRVVVVSACNAGAFADELADDDTAVIVASDAASSSAGCGVDAGATVFGRAFFEDGMGKGATLAQAFEVARDRVAAHDPAMHPRMHVGPGIAARLAELGRPGGAQRQARLPAARHG